MIERDPHDVRDEMIADYSTSVRKLGAEPDPRDIERIVQSDLATYEAVEREARHAAPAPAKPDDREDTAAIAAAEKGMYLYRAPEAEVKERVSPLLDANPFKMGPRFPFMMGRIRRIVETPPGLRCKTMDEQVAAAAWPQLARKFFSLWVFYNAPTIPHRANPFFGMSARDRARKWIRLVEDICDESSSRLGPWWVPK